MPTGTPVAARGLPEKEIRTQRQRANTCRLWVHATPRDSGVRTLAHNDLRVHTLRARLSAAPLKQPALRAHRARARRSPRSIEPGPIEAEDACTWPDERAPSPRSIERGRAPPH